MVGTHYTLRTRGINPARPSDETAASDEPAFFNVGLTELLARIPEPGDVVDLDEAVAIVARYDRYAYGQIVTLMNRGLVAADFIEAPCVDPEIVLRRL